MNIANGSIWDKSEKNKDIFRIPAVVRTRIWDICGQSNKITYMFSFTVTMSKLM
jgi:hypothetical protein